MLNHIMVAILYKKTHQQWEQITATRIDLPITAELITFLKVRCRTLELIQYTPSMKIATANSRAGSWKFLFYFYENRLVTIELTDRQTGMTKPIDYFHNFFKRA
jgi:hypothetical protein